MLAGANINKWIQPTPFSLYSFVEAMRILTCVCLHDLRVWLKFEWNFFLKGALTFPSSSRSVLKSIERKLAGLINKSTREKVGEK